MEIIIIAIHPKQIICIIVIIVPDEMIYKTLNAEISLAIYFNSYDNNNDDGELVKL
jgi:hypothetical protein